MSQGAAAECPKHGPVSERFMRHYYGAKGYMPIKYEDLTPRAFENAVSRLINEEHLSYNDRIAIADYALAELRRRAVSLALPNMKFPIRVDDTQAHEAALFFDTDNRLVAPEKLVEEANAMYELLRANGD